MTGRRLQGKSWKRAIQVGREARGSRTSKRKNRENVGSLGEAGDRNKRDVPGRLLCFQRAKSGARETLLVLHNIMKVIINAV
jgi:hypothetical protein